MRNSTSKPPVNIRLSGLHRPFGVKLRGRTFEDSTYRNTFNGKETDEETETQDYGMRVYDCDLGVFQSVDPIAAQYPYNSPFAFSENRVIDGIDLDGLEFVKAGEKYYKYVQPQAPAADAGPTAQWKTDGEPAHWNELTPGRTQIYSVNYKEIAQGVYQPIIYNKITTTPVKTIQVEESKTYVLNNGGTLNVNKLAQYENSSKKFAGFDVDALFSGVQVDLKYQSKGKQVVYLQTYASADGSVLDATEGQDPFYFHSYLKNGIFQDKPGSVGKNETVNQTFNLTVYEKSEGENTYKAVAILKYSYTITFDANGKGTVSNFKKTLTDISASPESKKTPQAKQAKEGN